MRPMFLAEPPSFANIIEEVRELETRINQTAMSNFTFLQTEWPDLHDAASKAEALAHPDAGRRASTRGEGWK